MVIEKTLLVLRRYKCHAICNLFSNSSAKKKYVNIFLKYIGIYKVLKYINI